MKLKKLLRTSLLLAVSVAAVYQLLAIVMLTLFRRKRGVAIDRQDWPPVSILKPISGKDEGLRDNLASFCVQDYPRYEVLMGFGDKNDAGIPISLEVARSFPLVARTVIEEDIPGANRKVANLIGLEHQSRFDLLAVSDSDMRVGPGYLKTIVGEHLQAVENGLVTCPYMVRRQGSLGAIFESLTIVSDLFPAVLVARGIEGMSFGLGASLLFSKPVLKEIGGLESVADYLADDYQIGYKIKGKGHGVILSQYVMDCVVGQMTLRDHIRHQLRWAVTYRSSRPKGYLLYGVTHLFPLALIFSCFRTCRVFIAPAAALSLRLALVLAAHGLIGRTWSCKGLMLLPFKDLLAFLVWFGSLFKGTVSWRGREYEIMKNGKMKELRTT